MLEFLSTIAESIGLFLQFIGSTVSGLLGVFGLAVRSLGWLSVAIGYMPSVLVGFAMTGIIITVLFQLIGR